MTHRRRLLLSVLPLLITVGCASILGDFEVAGDPKPGDEGGIDALADNATGDTNQPGLDGGGDAEAGDAGCKVPPGGTNLDDALQVSAGYNHTCAIRQDGSVVCWGDNAFGQLGVPAGTALASNKPIKVQFPAAELGSSRIRRIVAGENTTFAIDDQFRLWAWGNNENGMLAIGSSDAQSHPAPAIVKTGAGGQPLLVQQIASQWFAACALAVTGDIYCWGTNQFGGLGQSPPAPAEGVSSFVPVKAFNNVASPGPNAILSPGIGATDMCYAAGPLNDGMRCWGLRAQGQLLSNIAPPPQGGVNFNAFAPLTTAGASTPFRDMAYGTNYGAVLDNSGRLFTWGTNNNQQIHGPGAAPAAGEAKGTASGPYLQMTAGYVFLCVVDDQGTARCRGSNTQKQLGRVTTVAADNERLDPVVSNGNPLTNVRSVHAGFFHTCAIMRGPCGPQGPGLVKCWGQGDKGKLGHGVDVAESIAPVDVKAP